MRQRVREIFNDINPPFVLCLFQEMIGNVFNSRLPFLQDAGSESAIDGRSDFPSERMDQFKKWSDILVSMPKDASPEAAEKNQQERDQCEAELAAFFAGIIESKRKQPGQDIISILIKEEEEGEKLTPEDLIPFCNLLGRASLICCKPHLK